MLAASQQEYLDKLKKSRETADDDTMMENSVQEKESVEQDRGEGSTSDLTTASGTSNS